MFEKIILKYRLHKKGFKFLKVSGTIINQYKNTTRKNRNLDDFLVQLKLNRAVYSGRVISSNKDIKIIKYGFLEIRVDKNSNRIVYINNDIKGKSAKINFNKKKKISDIYKSVLGVEF